MIYRNVVSQSRTNRNTLSVFYAYGKPTRQDYYPASMVVSRVIFDEEEIPNITYRGRYQNEGTTGLTLKLDNYYEVLSELARLIGDGGYTPREALWKVIWDVAYSNGGAHANTFKMQLLVELTNIIPVSPYDTFHPFFGRTVSEFWRQCDNLPELDFMPPSYPTL